MALWREASKELKREIIKSKQDYRRKMENKMAANQLGLVWKSIKIIAGHGKDVHRINISLDNFNSDKELANALNSFYCKARISRQ